MIDEDSRVPITLAILSVFHSLFHLHYLYITIPEYWTKDVCSI
jgi:hypothetical protein